jgi:tetratricopeptide (TPR) repeat protein
LPKGNKPGEPVTLAIGAETPDLIFISPWNKTVILPSFENKSQNFVEIVLGKKGTREILAYPQIGRVFAESVLAQGSAGATPGEDVAAAKDKKREEALRIVADHYQLTRKDLTEAISSWLKSEKKDPYETAQAEIYNGNYSAALTILTALREQGKERLLRVLVAEAQAHDGAGQYDDAISALRDAIQLSANDPELHNALGMVLGEAGHYEQASHEFSQAISLIAKNRGPDHPDALAYRTNLAESLFATGQRDKALSINKEVLEVRLRTVGPDDLATITSKDRIAFMLAQLGQNKSAKAMLEDVVNIRAKKLGEDDLETLRSKIRLATILRDEGQFEAARKLEQFVVDARRRKLGPRHPETLLAIGNLDVTLREMGRRLDSRSLNDIYQANRETLGLKHPTTLISMNNLAASLYDESNFKGAIRLERECLAFRIEVSGASHPDTIQAMNNLSEFLFADGDVEGSLTLGAQVYDACCRLYGPEHPATLNSMHNMGGTLLKKGRLEEALELEGNALNVRFRTQGIQHPDTTLGLNEYSMILFAMGRLEEAQNIEQMVVYDFLASLGGQHPNTLRVISHLIEIADQRDDLPVVKNWLEQLLALQREKFGPKSEEALETEAELLRILCRHNLETEANIASLSWLFGVNRVGLTVAESQIAEEVLEQKYDGRCRSACTFVANKVTACRMKPRRSLPFF